MKPFPPAPLTKAAYQVPGQVSGGRPGSATNPPGGSSKGGKSEGPAQADGSRGAVEALRSQNRYNPAVAAPKVAALVPLPPAPSSAPKPASSVGNKFNTAVNVASLGAMVAPVIMNAVQSSREDKERYQREREALLAQRKQKQGGVFQKAVGTGADYLEGLGHHTIDQLEEAKRDKRTTEHLRPGQMPPQQNLT